MMGMKTKWLLIAVLSPLISFSQGDRSKGRVVTIASVGLAAGESTAKPLFQLSSGLVHGRWFTGIGAGLDQYNFNSVPLFADWRMNFGRTRLGFLYANGGYNFATKNKGLTDDWFKTTDRFYGGLYMDAGIGYRIRLSSLHRLLFSAGYSQKNISNKIGYTYPCLVPPCTEQVYTYQYNFGRIVTKLSWEFGKTK
jgi:hypothetical protein